MLPSQPAVVPTIDQIELHLGLVWSKVLQISHVNREDGFGTLGGESMAAMHVVMQIKERFNVEISLSQFFAAFTLKEVSRTIHTLMSAQPRERDDSAAQYEEGFI